MVRSAPASSCTVTSPGASNSVSGPVRSSTSPEKRLMNSTTESTTQTTPITPATTNHSWLGRSCDEGM